MILAAGLSDLPADAVGVLILLLISLASWIKKRFFPNAEEPPIEHDDPMREIIWRRQMGEAAEPPAPPPLPGRSPARPPAPPPPAARVPELSSREAALAQAFEKIAHRSRGRRSPHRRKVDAFLRSPTAAKDAIVLLEILGPPLALRPETDERP